MSDYKYTEQHEWVRVDGEEAAVGISPYAAGQLGDIVYVELPDIGKTFSQGDEIAVVESVKAASEVYAPVSGAVSAINEALGEAPATVNDDAGGTGWFLRLKMTDPAEMEKLMDEAAYKKFIEGLG